MIARRLRIEEGVLFIGRWYIVPFFRWFDLWMGAYWDQTNRRLYVCPVPTLGVYIGREDEEEDDGPGPCPGCHSFGQCEPGCIDEEVRLQRAHERDSYDYTGDSEEDEV